jgi:hypothetical protein
MRSPRESGVWQGMNRRSLSRLLRPVTELGMSDIHEHLGGEAGIFRAG